MGGLIPVLSLDTKIKKPQLIFIGSFVIAATAGVLNFIYTNSGSFYFNDLGYNHGQVELYEHVWHYTCLNLLFASFILSIVSIHGSKIFSFIRSALESKWMVRIGKVSYGMYLFHWAILVYVCNRLFVTENLTLKILFFIPYTLIVYVIAELSFRFYESRFLKLKDSLFTKKRTPDKSKENLPAIADATGALKSISNE